MLKRGQIAFENGVIQSVDAPTAGGGRPRRAGSTAGRTCRWVAWTTHDPPEALMSYDRRLPRVLAKLLNCPSTRDESVAGLIRALDRQGGPSGQSGCHPFWIPEPLYGKTHPAGATQPPMTLRRPGCPGIDTGDPPASEVPAAMSHKGCSHLWPSRQGSCDLSVSHPLRG